MNSVNLIGRLVKDPESRTTATGMVVATFTIAVDRRVKQGEEKKADFIRIITFGKAAETCAKYLAKGRQVGITGRIQTGSYDDKNGVQMLSVIRSRLLVLPVIPGTEMLMPEMPMLHLLRTMRRTTLIWHSMLMTVTFRSSF